jgi:hypothetical protein
LIFKSYFNKTVFYLSRDLESYIDGNYSR